MEDLIKLSASDLSKVEDDRLVHGIRTAHNAMERGPEWAGKFIAQLKQRHSWSELVTLTGLPQTTLHRWAQPFL